MSAVNVFVNSRRACLLTDSTIYAPDGTVVAFENKAYAIDSWTGAVTGRGNWWGPIFTGDLAEAYASFDEFLLRSAAVIEREHQQALAAGGHAGQTFIEVHVIGWSERRSRAEAYVLISPRADYDDDLPYVWLSLDENEGVFTHANFTAREQWLLHRQAAEEDVDWNIETFDPIRHGIPLMEMQRQRAATPQAGEGIAGKHVIGGQLWLTVVDHDGVRQGVIRTWERDRIGEPIRPEPLDESRLPRIPPSGMPASWPFERVMAAIEGGALDPETFELDKHRLAVIEAAAPRITGLSRQQRRAAEKRVRKGLARA